MIGIIILINVIFFGDIIAKLLDNGRGCKKQEKLYIETYDINGIIELKFYDPNNHRARTLRVLNKGFQQDFKFQGENHGFYEFVSEGDTVLKRAGSDTIKVVRAGQVNTFLIDFDCKPYEMPPISEVIYSKVKKWF